MNGVDAETQRLIGNMSANIEAIMKKQDEMEKKLDGVVGMTNRWKGATTILILVGSLIGWVTNLLFKGHT
jgi:tetrahydromethanopterin S-methyltransferase subunit G